MIEAKLHHAWEGRIRFTITLPSGALALGRCDCKPEAMRDVHDCVLCHRLLVWNIVTMNCINP